MTITWGQWCRGFEDDEITKAKRNVIKIKEKIIELNEKLLLKDVKKDLVNDLIDRLEMSKNCIKYYYGLDINL
tara:strand:+ start:302 stop:520 length:219 start_codon:yes stop_codon:yes gene_type:complete